MSEQIMKDRISGAGLLLCSALLAAGCGQNAPPPAPPQTPVIPVSRPVERTVTDYVEFTGRTNAVQAVDVRPRVTGYLTKVSFKEGSEVKEGQELFEVDPRPYKAQLEQTEAQIKLNEADLELAERTLARDLAVAKTPGAVSQQQLDQDRAMVAESKARLKSSKASAEIFKLNLEFTNVKSPIAGKTSRYYLTPGNLVNQDQTLLTSVMSLDPIYAYFDMDETTLLRIRMAINKGLIKLPEAGTVPVFLGLQGETDYPHEGKLDFVNNQVNPGTGSITFRGVFPNPLPAGGARLLSPGMFVRIRLPIGQPHPALLVIDRAIGSDQGLKYVYVVDAQNTVQYRRVTIGALQDDGLRVIIDGIKKGERVVVGALQQVRPRAQIQPEETPMPSLGQQPAPEQPTQGQPKQGQPKLGPMDTKENAK